MNDLSKNKPIWWPVWILATLLLGLLLYNLCSKNWMVDEYILGLLGLFIIIILVACLKPQKISTNFGSIEREVQEIRKDLRPYAIINSSGIVHSTFDNGVFKLEEVEITENKQELEISFKSRPKHVEFRQDQGGGFNLETENGTDGRIIYKCHLSDGYFNDSATYIVEAYL